MLRKKLMQWMLAVVLVAMAAAIVKYGPSMPSANAGEGGGSLSAAAEGGIFDCPQNDPACVATVSCRLLTGTSVCNVASTRVYEEASWYCKPGGPKAACGPVAPAYRCAEVFNCILSFPLGVVQCEQATTPNTPWVTVSKVQCD